MEPSAEAYDATIQLPRGASTLAGMVDELYYEIFWISVVLFVAITGCMLYFAWRYRRRPGVASKQPGKHTKLELLWTFAPLILLAYMFHQGFEGFMFMSVPPEGALTVRVRAYKWRWEFEQPNGMRESELNVPVRRPVRLVMSSHDNPRSADADDLTWRAVIHSFYVPAFRIKRDVVPGMYTSMWFEATAVGDYPVYCAEYCGTGHSRMLSTVHVMPAETYDRYLQLGPQRPAEFADDVAWGESLFSSNGCAACHGIEAEGPVRVGPNLGNVAGYEQPIDGGEPMMADAEYLERALREPQAEIVEGSTGASMPAFDSMPTSQMHALLSYLLSLSDRGEQVELPEPGAGEGEGGE